MAMGLREVRRFAVSHPRLLLFFAFAVMHLCLIPEHATPLISDEMHYFRLARLWLNYADPDLSVYPGFSALLIPWARGFDDARMGYVAALYMNGVLAACIPVLGYALLTRLRPDQPPLHRWLCAAALGLYPSFVLFAKLVETETTLIVAFMALAVVVTDLLARPRQWWRWPPVVLLLLFLVAVHPRSITLVPAFCVSLFAALLWHFPAHRRTIVIASLVGGVVVVGLLLLQVQNSRGYAIGTRAIVTALTDPRFIAFQFFGIVGCFYYLSCGTYTAVSFGLAFSLRRVVDRSTPLPLRLTHFFLLFVFVTVLFMSTVDLNPNAPPVHARADGPIYGRYIEAVLAPTLLIGISEIAAARLPIRRWAFTVLTTLFLTAIVYWQFFESFRELPLVISNIFAVYGYRFFTGAWHFSMAHTLGIFLTGVALIYVLQRFRPILGLLGLSVCFTLVTAFGFFDFFGKGTSSRSGQLAILPALRMAVSLAEHEPDGRVRVAHDKVRTAFWHFNNDLFYVPELKLHDIDANLTVPQEALMLSSKAQLPAGFVGWRVVGLENHFAHYLWVRPGILQDRLAAAGYLLPDPLDAPLPPPARKASMSVAWRGEQSYALAKDLHIPLAVRHEGGAAPWPNRLGLRGVAGHVFVVARVLSELPAVTIAPDEFDLPVTMYPGDRVALDINPRFQIAPNADLEGKRIELRLELAQKGEPQVRFIGGTVRLFFRVSGGRLVREVTNERLLYSVGEQEWQREGTAAPQVLHLSLAGKSVESTPHLKRAVLVSLAAAHCAASDLTLTTNQQALERVAGTSTDQAMFALPDTSTTMQGFDVRATGSFDIDCIATITLENKELQLFPNPPRPEVRSVGFADGWTNGDAAITNLDVPLATFHYVVVQVRGRNPFLNEPSKLAARIVVDGTTVRPEMVDRGELYFRLPPDSSTLHELRIQTSTFVPAEVVGNTDTRVLGLDVEQVLLR